jgi:anti-anti-sigma factor
LHILFGMPRRPLSFDVVTDDDGGLCLAVSGEVDLNTAPALEATAGDLLNRRPRTLVLDFAGVPFCDSSGIGVLVRLYNKSTVTGSRLTLRRPTPNVRAILEMTALTRIFHVEDAE